MTNLKLANIIFILRFKKLATSTESYPVFTICSKVFPYLYIPSVHFMPRIFHCLLGNISVGQKNSNLYYQCHLSHLFVSPSAAFSFGDEAWNAVHIQL